MVIYEVNISINNVVYDDYYKWLLAHMSHILTLTGFMQAEIGVVEQDNDATTQLRVNYHIDSYENFQSYLKNDAPRLRAEGLQKFGDRFSASRRVILDHLVIKT